VGDLLGIVGALAVLVIPLLLAWLLVGRGGTARARRNEKAEREKIPS
jgi:hypothetical protein